MKTIHILIEKDEINDINGFLLNCNIEKGFSPSMFGKLELLVSDTKDSEKTTLFDVTEDVRFFQLDKNDDTKFNKCDKNVDTIATDYSVAPSVNDLETLKKEIDKDKTKCFWLAVTFDKIVKLKKANKSDIKSKYFLKPPTTLEQENEELLREQLKKELTIEFEKIRKSDVKEYTSQIKKLENGLKKEQKTSTDLRLHVSNKDKEIVKYKLELKNSVAKYKKDIQNKNTEVANINKKKDNQIKTLTNQLNNAKKYTYTAIQYNSGLAKERENTAKYKGMYNVSANKVGKYNYLRSLLLNRGPGTFCHADGYSWVHGKIQVCFRYIQVEDLTGRVFIPAGTTSVIKQTPNTINRLKERLQKNEI